MIKLVQLWEGYYIVDNESHSAVICDDSNLNLEFRLIVSIVRPFDCALKSKTENNDKAKSQINLFISNI